MFATTTTLVQRPRTDLFRYWFLCLLMFAASAAFAQQFTGQVIDAGTQEPLPYASVLVPTGKAGGITDADGKFSIALTRIERNDSAIVTYLGYQRVALSLGSLNFNESQTIRMKPAATLLKPVSIAAKVKTKALGNTRASSRKTGWGDFKSLRGRTRGLLIGNRECPLRVKSFSFRIDDNDWDSVAFRLNFLRVVNGKPAESILGKNIFINVSRAHAWVTVDLQMYNVIICDSILATLEWVDAWGTTGESSNVLTISLAKEKGYTFMREPVDEFGTFGQAEYTPAMYLEVFTDD
ncbi:MAG TPA: carboxypeptidase-like regulatory domain-containing protein [Chryseosolibacter sp.]